MRKLTVPIAAVVIALTLVSSAPASAQVQGGGHYNFFTQQMTEPWESLLGKPAPNVRLKTLDGGTFDLGSFKGKKVVVMDFWATWCPPCRIVMPILSEVVKAYKDKEVVFYTINASDPPEYIKRFLETNGLDLKVALDEGGGVTQAYKVDTIPRLIIVGKDGTVQSVHAGLEGRSPEQVQANFKRRLTEELDKLLAGENLVGPAPTEATLEAKKDAP